MIPSRGLLDTAWVPVQLADLRRTEREREGCADFCHWGAICSDQGGSSPGQTPCPVAWFTVLPVAGSNHTFSSLPVISSCA